MVAIPKLVEERVGVPWVSNAKAFERNRAVQWGLVQLASSRGVSEFDLFISSGIGTVYSLTPTSRSSVPLQWAHVGPGAIPDTLADVPCQLLTKEDLLSKLNSVLGTSHTLDAPGLQECLEYVLRASYDFGGAYGILRPWWAKGFLHTLEEMKRREEEVRRQRESAIHGTCIQDSRLPPRRVWDLRSNRILPFHVIPRAEYVDPQLIPINLWTVSHSWVDEQERDGVWTAINGRQWPVPIPRSTSLGHVRIELLNLGAEYVWLDVLCLRQEGGKDDKLRLEEWKIDVPTIGHVFQAYPSSRPCITYFNGLGLPLDTSPATLQSNRHWFKRVWTLQESLDHWLPGGLTADPLMNGSAFFAQLQDLLSGFSKWRHQASIIQALRSRHCTTELDRVAGLAYHLECKTLPLYDPTISVESAWTLLIKHMDGWPRTFLFLQYASDTPFGLWVSWKGLLASQPALPFPDTVFYGKGKLELVNQVQLYTDEPGQYFHWGYAIGPCRVTCSARDARHLYLHFENGDNSIAVNVTDTHGHILPNVAYTFVGIGENWKECWVAVEVVGKRQVRGKRALEAIKWGVIRMDKVESKRVTGLGLGRPGTRIMYLSSEEALVKSKHVGEYMKVFNEAREGGKTSIIDS